MQRRGADGSAKVSGGGGVKALVRAVARQPCGAGELPSTAGHRASAFGKEDGRPGLQRHLTHKFGAHFHAAHFPRTKKLALWPVYSRPPSPGLTSLKR